MLSLPEIKNLLTDRQLNVVAERVGIHSNTIYRLMKVEKADYDTIKKLSDYLEGQLENAKNNKEAASSIMLRMVSSCV